jgi:hypothetical protein
MPTRVAAAIVEGMATAWIATRPRARRPPRAAADRQPTAVVEPAAPDPGRRGPGTPVTLETVVAAWCSALDAVEAAVRAARSSLGPGELRTLSAQLSTERASTVDLLQEVARAERVPAQLVFALRKTQTRLTA